MTFGTESLAIDAEAEVDRITAALREYGARNRRRGAVLGVSGGIDSSVVAALCVEAFGPERVFALHMPERESSSDTLGFSRSLTDWLGVDSLVEDLTEILTAAGAYERRDAAIRRVVPEYGPGWRSKIVLPSVTDSDAFRLYSVVAEAPDGRRVTERLTTEAYLEIVAATNFKQRVRKMMEYSHADRLNYIVAGTPNRLEYDQGFFVKLGDGAADVKPIAHLYKTQVYALAAHLGVPAEICRRPPTTDTYSLAQTQEEFYFSLPYDRMDLCLYGLNHGLSAAETGAAAGLTPVEVERVWADIAAKRSATRYLHLGPQLVAEVPELKG